jgi:hypothetical protein
LFQIRVGIRGSLELGTLRHVARCSDKLQQVGNQATRGGPRVPHSQSASYSYQLAGQPDESTRRHTPPTSTTTTS